MIGKLIGAGLGRRLAARNGGMGGMMLGAAAPWLLRRAFTPLGVAALGAYGVKKLYDRRRARREGAQPQIQPQIQAEPQLQAQPQIRADAPMQAI